jgi:hypothetical protein
MEEACLHVDKTRPQNKAELRDGQGENMTKLVNT